MTSSELILRAIVSTVIQLLCFGGLIAVCAVVLLHLDRIMSGILSQTFSWKSVLWTGWLGTPIHELSHAAMCVVFLHRIEKVVLYNPDPQTGVLGFVQHSYNPKNLWSKLGCVFIGLAPLLGGALALGLAMYFLAPSSPLRHIQDFGQTGAIASQGLSDQAVRALRLTTTVFTETMALDNLKRWQTWLFLYLVLCIGTHMAPSKADFAGSRTGVGALGIALLSAIVIAHLLGETGSSAIQTVLHYLMPVIPLFMIAVALNLAALAAVFTIVFVFRVLKGDSRNLLSRMIAPHWRSLAIVGCICLALFLAVNSAGKTKPGAVWRDAPTRWIAR